MINFEHVVRPPQTKEQKPKQITTTDNQRYNYAKNSHALAEAPITHEGNQTYHPEKNSEVATVLFESTQPPLHNIEHILFEEKPLHIFKNKGKRLSEEEIMQRDQQIATLIGKGMTILEMSEKLKCSPSLIYVSVNRLHEKGDIDTMPKRSVSKSKETTTKAKLLTALEKHKMENPDQVIVFSHLGSELQVSGTRIKQLYTKLREEGHDLPRTRLTQEETDANIRPLIMQGLSDADIAQKLQLSASRVRARRPHIVKKTAKNNT